MWGNPVLGTHSGMVIALAILVALAVDEYAGEPPNRWHPVVAIGWCLDALGQRIAPLASAHAAQDDVFSKRNFVIFCASALAWIATAALFLIAFYWLEKSILILTSSMLPTAHTLVSAMVLGVLLKPMLAYRMLSDEVKAVEQALQSSLAAGRERLSCLVSRDVALLSAADVRESAIETLAENLNDSVVAPVFWFAIAGLPGAVLYRVANTADAMWGYRGVRGGRVWTWAGKWAARVDDVLSWMPARLTTALLWTGLSWSRWRKTAAEASKTPSPNGGWCMGAMALALQVRLGKPKVYVLNEQAPTPDAAAVMQALKYAEKLRLALIWMALAVVVLGLLGYSFENHHHTTWRP